MRLPRWLRWRTDRELDEEMQAHLDLETDCNLERGLPPADARAAARRTLGNLTLLQERAREADPLGWLLSVRQDLRYAFRNLARNPGFTAVAVLSLGLGIGANTAIFTVINAAMLKSLPVSHPEELVMLTQVGETAKNSASFPNALWEQIRDHQDVFVQLFSYGSTHVDLSSGGEARPLRAGFVSGEFFPTLGVRAAAGRVLADADDHRGCPCVAVISHAFWQEEYGGAADVIGKAITLDGYPFRIVGVTEPAFFGLEYGYHVPLWVPSCSEAIVRRAVGGSMGRMVMGRPRPGVGLGQIRARFAALGPDLLAATAGNPRTIFGVMPFSRGIPGLQMDYGFALLILLATAGLVLLIACANVANLLLARASARQREIAVRLALGASRARLIRQLLTESLLLAFVGAAVGMLFAAWGSQALVGFLSRPRNIVLLDLTPDRRVLAFTLAAAVLAGILFGLVPAWHAVRADLHSAMKRGGRGMAEGRSRFGFGKILVAAQVALSLVALVSAGLLLGSWRRLATLDPGFRSRGVLLADVNTRPARIPADQRETTYRRILERLRAIPGVAMASAAERTPIGHRSWSTTIQALGSQSGTEAVVELNEVSDGYFASIGTHILSGRDFSASDVPTSPPVAIVSQELARRIFGDATAIGQYFRVRYEGQIPPAIRIVGIAANTKLNELREASQPIVYLALNQNTRPLASINFLLRTADPPTTLIPGVKAAIVDIAPHVSLELDTLEGQLDESVRLPRTLGLLSGFFGALALLLASIGLYGIMAYTVARRRNEIGVRIALGAGRPQIIRMVLADMGRIAAAGVATGTLLSLAVTRLVAQFLYQVEPNDPATLAICAMTLLAVSIGAAMMPARSAAGLDPVAALRED